MGWRSWIQAAWERVRHPEIALVAGLAFVALALLGFAKFSSEVLEGETTPVDEAILRALRRADAPDVPIGPTWLQESAVEITALGSASILLLVVLTSSGYLLLMGKRRAGWLILAATASGQALTVLLQSGFQRPRPSVVSALDAVHTYSFPSGHTLMSSLTFLTLGAMLAEIEGQHWPERMYILGMAILAALLVGLSRVYLGVHYPTDVLGGWVVGSAWACLWWLLARRLKVWQHQARPAGSGARPVGPATP